MNRVREHVAFVSITFVLPTDGKRLARRAARNQVNLVFPRTQVNLPNVAIEKPQIRPHRAVPILTERVTRIRVPFNHGNGIEAGIVHAERKPTPAGKKFDRVHPPAFYRFRFDESSIA
jgi:hypothetical protein